MKILDRERSKDKLKVGFGKRISEMNSNKYDLYSDDDKSIQSPAIIKQRDCAPLRNKEGHPWTGSTCGWGLFQKELGAHRLNGAFGVGADQVSVSVESVLLVLQPDRVAELVQDRRVRAPTPA